MTDQQEPGREGPAFGAPLGKSQVGARLVVAHVEQQGFAHRRARGREALEFGRFAEQGSTHGLTCRTGTPRARQR